MGDYSSGDEASLPTDSTNLDHVYDGTDLANVGTNDTNYVNQTGSAGYELHQYKDSITATSASVTWIGKSSLAPSSSKVQLQVYKVAAPAGWQDVSGAGASNNVAAADTDFTLSGTVATADYLDTGVITFRVYQAAAFGETVMAFYPEANYTSDYYLNVSAGSRKWCGQTFMGDGNRITSAEFYLHKVGNPSGNTVFRVRALDGPGTPPAPGTVLATSEAKVSDTISSSVELVKLTFPTPYETVDGITYFISCEVDGGNDIGNWVDFGFNNTEGIGSMWYNIDGTWTERTDATSIFYVYGTP